LKNLTLQLKSLLSAFGEINPDSIEALKWREPAILVLVAVFARRRQESSNGWEVF
jgi:hypothetical protein